MNEGIIKNRDRLLILNNDNLFDNRLSYHTGLSKNSHTKELIRTAYLDGKENGFRLSDKYSFVSDDHEILLKEAIKVIECCRNNFV